MARRWWRWKQRVISYSVVLLLLLARAGAQGDHITSAGGVGVRILAPVNGEKLPGDAEEVTFTFEAYGYQAHNSSGHIVLCFTVVNKRVSHYQSTHCLDDDTQPYILQGFVPGVWRVRAYLVDSREEMHWRGGHANVLGSDSTAQFLVDEEAWVRQTRLGDIDRYFSDLHTPLNLPNNDRLGYEALLREHPRLRALELTRALMTRPGLQWMLSTHLGSADPVMLVMLNDGHLALAKNALFFLHRAGLLRHTLVLGVGLTVCSALIEFANTTVKPSPDFLLSCYTLPDVSSFCPHCASERRDVWSEGFPDMAVLKPACVLALLELGRDVLWLDTDVVVLQSPFAHIHPQADLAIQSGGAKATDIVRTVEDSFRGELCTGFYLVRSGRAMNRVLTHAVMEMALHTGDHRFGDQAATNLVLFESTFRGFNVQPTVQVLDTLLYPGGALYFDTDLWSEEGRTQQPVIVHNNYIFGMDAKIRRFRDRGLWYEDVLRTEAMECAARRGPAVVIEGMSPHDSDSDNSTLATCLCEVATGLMGGDVLRLTRSPRNERHERVVVTLSLGRRPWFRDLVEPRLRYYARKVGADLIVVEGDKCEADEGSVPDFRTCAQGTKIALLSAMLRCYSRVLLIDDTALVNRDCYDLFSFLPSHVLGAVTEDERVSTDDELDDFVALSCIKYGVEPVDGLWFNSGVLLVSRELVSPEQLPPPPSLDPRINGDQGYLNALRHKHRWDVWNLGYRFNYVGSFEGKNADRKPLSATEASIVHATTGLPNASDEGRCAFLKEVNDAWEILGE